MESALIVLQRFKDVILDPTIYLILTAGFLVFVWGLVQFIWKMREGSDYKEGVQHMLWGIIGMFIMVSVYGIIALIENTIGADPTNPDFSRVPEVSPDLFK